MRGGGGGGSYSLLVFCSFRFFSLKLAFNSNFTIPNSSTKLKAWDKHGKLRNVWWAKLSATAALLVQINSKLNKANVVERRGSS